MGRVKQFDAFVSYSRNDQKLVEPLVQLMSLNGRRIFWDAISIKPGELWENTLEEALRNSRLVVVLWCCDTASSEWVSREIHLALKLKKKLVPIILCSYPVSASIGARQWIDLRPSVRHECSASYGSHSKDAIWANAEKTESDEQDGPMGPLPAPSPSGKRVWMLRITGFGIVLGFGAIFTLALIVHMTTANHPLRLPGNNLEIPAATLLKKDTVAERLLQLARKKQARKKDVVKTEAPAKRAEVIDIMEALKRSLGQAGSQSRRESSPTLKRSSTRQPSHRRSGHVRKPTG